MPNALEIVRERLGPIIGVFRGVRGYPQNRDAFLVTFEPAEGPSRNPDFRVYNLTTLSNDPGASMPQNAGGIESYENRIEIGELTVDEAYELAHIERGLGKKVSSPRV